MKRRICSQNHRKLRIIYYTLSGGTPAIFPVFSFAMNFLKTERFREYIKIIQEAYFMIEVKNLGQGLRKTSCGKRYQFFGA